MASKGWLVGVPPKGESSFFRAMVNHPLLNGRLIEDIEVSPTVVVNVQHGLGRDPIGYMVVKMSAAIDTYVTWTAANRDVLVVDGTAAGSAYTISLWVF